MTSHTHANHKMNRQKTNERTSKHPCNAQIGLVMPIITGWVENGRVAVHITAVVAGPQVAVQQRRLDSLRAPTRIFIQNQIEF